MLLLSRDDELINSLNILLPDEILSSIPNHFDEVDSEDILVASRFGMYKDLEDKLDAEGLME